APSAAATSSGEFIVTGTGVSAVSSAVTTAGGSVLTSLPIVNGVLAQLPDTGVLAAEGLNVTPDSPVSIQMAPSTAPAAATVGPVNVFATDTGASQLASEGITGAGVTVAVLDTGIDALPDFAGRLIGGVDLTGAGNPFADAYGHGTFVAGLVAGNGASSNGEYSGEAPGANLVSIKVAGASGVCDVATVIEGIQWAIEHAAAYNIKVLNMSLGEVPPAPTALNPLDRAAEAAWNSGITVVTSAGNTGPDPGTIVAPGDDPLVITVGALNDQHTVTTSDDSVPSFSAEGPTAYDAWLKPDFIAAGRSVVSLAAPGSTIFVNYPSARIGSANFIGSGTSFSTAITSGAVALLLQADPGLTPNQVKARLSVSAQPAPEANPLVVGHGDLNVAAAAAMPDITLAQNYAGITPPQVGQSIPLSTVWSLSSFNASNYSGPATQSTAWDSTAWDSTAWDSTAWDSTAWDSTAWDSTAWDSTAWDSTAWD
ncbi:MAG: S8 family peptidase, partial [Mycobacteriales bacterium]